MRKWLNVVVSVAMLGTGIVTFAAPAHAQSYRQQQRYVERYCARNPRDRDCRDFRRDARRWDDRRYRRFARERRGISGDAAAAAIFGLAAGAVIGGATRDDREYRDDNSRGHVRRCLNRYRSYDPETDTYLSSDGRRKACNL